MRFLPRRSRGVLALALAFVAIYALGAVRHIEGATANDFHSAPEGSGLMAASSARKAHTLVDDFNKATSVALVRVTAVSPAMANTPDGVAPTPEQVRTLGYSLFTVSQITYDVLSTFKGTPPLSEWMPRGSIPHPPGTLVSSSEDFVLPSVGSQFVLFLKDGTDWRQGQGTALIGYPRAQVCQVDDQGLATCLGYSMPLTDLIGQLQQLAAQSPPPSG